MAVNRVLTSDEKFILQADTRFQKLCKQSILDKSLYWTGQDGATPPGNDRVKWAKSRLRGQAIVRDPGQANGSTASEQFIIFLKNINLWDNAVVVFDPNVVCDYMLAQGTFDVLSDNWMDQQIRGIDF